MRKCFFFITGILLPTILTIAQSTQIHRLTIGDTVPDITIGHILNYKSPSAKLSDFKGKLIILDFWSVHCGGCVEFLPHMDSLQSYFGGALQVITVNTVATTDNEDKVKSFIQKYRVRTGFPLNFPFIILDTLLDRFFPHRVIPHYVLIDSNLIVRAITGPNELTINNIQAIIKGENREMHREEDLIGFNPDIPLFVKGNLGENESEPFIGRSILTGWREGDFPWIGQRRNDRNEITGFYMFDRSLSELLTNAYSNSGMSFAKNRLVVNLDTTVNIDPLPNESSFRYLYCYDLTIPPSSFENLQKYLREDIEKYFHILVTKEIRSSKCLVIRETENLSKSFSQSAQKIEDFENKTLHKFLRAYTIPQVISVLNSYSPLPIIDESKSAHLIDLDLPFDLSDTKALTMTLRKAGFEVREEERDLEMTVISQKQN